MTNNFWFSSAAELIKAIDSRETTAEQICEGYIERINRYKRLNAVCEINEHAVEDAKRADRSSPLRGLPVLVKDNIDVKGMHTTAGSRALKDNVATKNAPVIENIIRNGGVILGKTNMTEFANFVSNDMPNGYSSLSGQVVNAYDDKKDPSGSSTGSAVAVSAGLCAFAVGTDTSFSVVGCATNNGVSGLKPEYGSLESAGIVPISKTLDMAGALARSFSDAYMLYSCMRSSPLPALSQARCASLRIAVNKNKRDIVSDYQMGLYTELMSRMSKDGCTFTEIDQPGEPQLYDIMLNEFRSGIQEYLAYTNSDIKTYDELLSRYEKSPQDMMKYGISHMLKAKNTDERAYAAALERRRTRRLEVTNELAPFDACLMTGPTNVMHFTGLPSVAIKLAMGNDDTPRGAILYGTDEKRLFEAAALIESYAQAVLPPKLN